MAENHYMCIYRLISPSGKSYIGQARDFNAPMITHAGRRDGCPKLIKAVEKYGWENFEQKILAENLTIEEMNFLEEFCISVFDSISNGYNITCGGYGARGENGRNLNYGTGKYGVTKDDLSAWRKSVYEHNREKILQQQKISYYKRADKIRAQKKIYWGLNKEDINSKRRESYALDSSDIRLKNHEYYLNNKRKIENYNKKYYEKNKGTILKRTNDVLEGCEMMFPNISNKDSFRKIFLKMFGGGRTTCRRRADKHDEIHYVKNDWGDWLYVI